MRPFCATRCDGSTGGVSAGAPFDGAADPAGRGTSAKVWERVGSRPPRPGGNPGPGLDAAAVKRNGTLNDRAKVQDLRNMAFQHTGCCVAHCPRKLGMRPRLQEPILEGRPHPHERSFQSTKAAQPTRPGFCPAWRRRWRRVTKLPDEDDPDDLHVLERAQSAVLSRLSHCGTRRARNAGGRRRRRRCRWSRDAGKIAWSFSARTRSNDARPPACGASNPQMDAG